MVYSNGPGDSWRPVKKGKLTAGQWSSLVSSGGVVDASGSIWYPTAGALKGAMATKDFNNPEGINSDKRNGMKSGNKSVPYI